MKTLEDVLWFAGKSALAALDDCDGFDDPVASHRQNIRDTLNEYGMAAHEAAAWELFDAMVATRSYGVAARMLP